MAKYRKKPVVIEAFQMGIDSLPAWANEALEKQILVHSTDGFGHSTLIINTLEGVMLASANDFVIQGIQGEIYPCKPDIFKKTYELVN